MKIIIWGIGKYYWNRKKDLDADSRIEIVAFCDNNPELWGKVIDEIQVISPKLIGDMQYDAILIMSSYVREIQEQLIGMGVKSSKIIFWELFYAERMQGKQEIFQGISIEKKTGKKILIISTYLSYNGGSLVAVYASIALQNIGYDVILAIPDGNKKLIEEVIDSGVTVAVCPALPYIYAKEREWIQEFDIVIVNVLQMMQSAYAIALICPTLWWIHEASELYDMVLKMPWNNVEEDKLDNINIYAVSSLAQKNFNTYFSDRIKQTLCYGIPDMVSNKIYSLNSCAKIVFAIIGVISEGKAQDIFVEAVKRLNSRKQIEFWIIGPSGENEFNEKIKADVAGLSSVKLMGILTRKQMYDAFQQIDVVVCASREDSLPIVMTEGMMFGKVCITTDKTGTADYIKDGINGFIIPTEDVDALKTKMEWIIDNVEKLEPLRIEARKTYEEYFSMDAFGERLEKALMETEEKWQAAHSTKQ